MIFSLERMRAVPRQDPQAGTMTVETGAILADIHARAEAEDGSFRCLWEARAPPVGSGFWPQRRGVNVIRYGNTRDLVLGVEAVLADGTVVNTLSPLRKNNTGYDLRHLLIGSEGTLGVITAASLRPFPNPPPPGPRWMVVPSPRRRWGCSADAAADRPRRSRPSS